jgi:hypothetical protein
MAEDALIFDVDILDHKIQKLEAENQGLILENQVWKLLAHGVSQDEISRKTGLTPDEVQRIIQTET